MGPFPKNLKPAASEAWRLAEARVLRVMEVLGGSFVRVLRVLEALGGSFVRVLRVREAPGGSFVRALRVRGAPGGSRFQEPMKLGGSAKEGPHACGGMCFTCRGGSGRFNLYGFTCPGGFGRLICTCFTCPGGSGGFDIPPAW